MENAETRQFKAHRGEFAAVRSFVETACRALPRGHIERVVLIAEELFSNTIEHGYCGDSDQPVWFTLKPSTAGCVLVYRDAAPAHDPFVHDTSPELPSDPQKLPVGGLGVFLIGQFCTVKHYERHADHNVIEVFVPRDNSPNAARSP